MFGYDASSINDALPIIEDEFNLSDSMKGNVVSILLLGAVIGSLLAGFPADYLGRRLTIIISAVLFIVGCTVSSYVARNVALLIIGRLIVRSHQRKDAVQSSEILPSTDRLRAGRHLRRHAPLHR